MRWRALFDDLEAQFARSLAAGDEARDAERAEDQWRSIGFLDRVRPGSGDRIECRLASGTVLAGEVVARGANWLALGNGRAREGAGALPGGRVTVIAAGAIWSVVGLRPAGISLRSPSEAALPIASPLRRIAAAGIGVRLQCACGQFSGRIVVVGSDHLDLATGPRTMTLPLAQIESVTVG